MRLIANFLLLLFLFMATTVIANDNSVQQNRKSITGTVVDENGDFVIGASVTVPGTTIGTVTDMDGKFQLNVPAENNSIQVTYLGYENQDVSIANRTTVFVNMVPSSQGLDEVIVIGYGTIKKRDLTGAVTSVKNDDIVLNPGNNPMQALQGKVAGLDITRESGQPGAGINMQLRGTRSFTASGNPTFIIDGMPGDYETLNPNDIESIEVLKDASSTAIYGSAGANGVIIITTKSGKEGKTRVDLNAYLGVNGWSTTPEMRSGESYIQALRDANKATGNWSSTADDEKLFSSPEAYQAHLAGKYIDWADQVMQNNLTQNYSLSISGGNEKTKAYVSFNFSEEQGQYKADDYKVYSSNIRVDHKVRNWMKAGVNMQASYVHRNKSYMRLDRALAANPLGEVYDENGKINVNPVIDDTNTLNLMLDSQSGVYKNQEQKFKMYFNPYIELNPLKGLSILSRIGATIDYSRTNYFQGEGSYRYYNEAGSSSVGTNPSVYATVTDKRGYHYKWENILTYNFNINKEHDFTLTGVTSWNHNRNDEIYLKQDNITNNKYLWHNIQTANSEGTSSYNMSKGMAYIGRLNYSYIGKYLFSASIRHDGSSRLAKDNRWDTFPAVSAGWRISEEAFMAGASNWLDNLKIRVGYGVTGTAKIDPYTSSSNLEQSYYTIGGSQVLSYLFSENYTNLNLGWEKSYSTNLGLDLSIIKNRINLTADFYLTDTDGVIWERRLPVVNGAYNASTYYYTNLNICETENKGVEIALNTRNVETRDFQWITDFTFAYNKEKIKSLTDGTSDNIIKDDYALSIGHAVNSYYQLKKTGIWQLGEEADADVFNMKPGDIKFDIPGLIKESDGVWYKIDEETGDKIYYNSDNKYAISDNDRQIIGKNSPDWTMGFKNTFVWKDFDLSIFMYARWGQMIKYDFLGTYDPKGLGNFPEYFDYWTESNSSNDFPAINSSRAINDYIGYTSLTYVDGSFFKIKNITLGYTMPSQFAKKIGVDKFRIYGTMTNPLVISKSDLIKDYDPEMNGSFNYPLTKQLVFGVNLTF